MLTDVSLLVTPERLRRWRAHYARLLEFALRTGPTGTAVQKAEEHLALCELAERAMRAEGR